MTEETPAKVFSLLGIALTSMFFLFMVTVTNANFSQTEKPLPVVFKSQQVVAVLDNAANSYSNFLSANLFQPLKSQVALYTDTGRWVIDNTDMAILNATGLTALAEVQTPTVAGAYTQQPVVENKLSLASNSNQSFSVDTLYYLLIR